MSDSSENPKSIRTGGSPAGIPVRLVFLAVGFVQGLALYGIGESAWLEENPVFGYSLRLLATAWPVLFLLTYRPDSVRRGIAWVSAFAVLLALLASYIGWQATPFGSFSTGALSTVFAMTALVSGFVALLHLQAAIWRMDREYDLVFTLSWRNFLTISLSWGLTLGVRLVLFLWESLFSAVGVEFYSDLFVKDWFMFPVLATAFAFGLHSFSSATSVLDRIASLLARLMWILLPLTLLITTLFLISLPAIGLQPLVRSDRGPLLLMAINLVALFSLNAVYQTGKERPYARLAHRMVSVGLALLPVLSALAVYALLSRVSQYGWTPGRCWAAFALSLAALFSVAYTFVIVRRRDAWASSLAGVNKRMSWVVLVAVMLTSSPLLDFRVISTQSQFARVESGEVSLDVFGSRSQRRFDLYNAREELARPGHLRIQALAASLDKSDPDWANRLRAFLGDEHEAEAPGWSEAQQQRIVLRPVRFEIPEGLAEAIKGPTGRGLISELPDLLFRVDLGGRDGHEYVSVQIHNEGRRLTADCWNYVGGKWAHCGHAFQNSISPEVLGAELRTGVIEVVEPEYMDLRVGKQVLQFR